MMTDVVPGDELRLDDDEVRRRKAFLEFGPRDVDALNAIGAVASAYAGPVIEEFYRHLLSFDETKVFFGDPKTLARVKELQKHYFLRLTGGEYGASYVANRTMVGAVHQRINLPLKWYLGSFNFLSAVGRARAISKGVSGSSA